MRVVIVEQGDAELLEIVGALGAAGRVAGHLYGGQEERNEDADDGDNNQQLDEGKGGRGATMGHVMRQHECLLGRKWEMNQ